MTTTVTVQVPATTANLGVGFDSFGLALNQYNTFQFTKATAFSFCTSTASPIQLPSLTPQNTCPDSLVFQTLQQFYQQCQRPIQPVAIEATVTIPLGRGLGSSATAVVATLVGLNALENYPLTTEALLALAIEIEGHPDNVAPALLGGFQICNQQITRPLNWCEAWQFLAIIPTFEVTTATSRGLLPNQYSRNTVVEALRNSALFVHAVTQADAPLLKQILEQDAIHEPYRGQAIPYFQQLRTRLATQEGVLGTIISGSGPTVLVVHFATAEATIRTVTQEVLSNHPINNVALSVLQQDTRGAKVITP